MHSESVGQNGMTGLHTFYVRFLSFMTKNHSDSFLKNPK